MSDCKICDFNNPQPTASALIVGREGKTLLVKRNMEPFKGEYDLVGGYLDGGETPEEALKRETKEEITVSKLDYEYLGCFSGESSFEDRKFPTVNFVYLMEIKEKPDLDTEENSEYDWFPIEKVENIAFEPNKKAFRYFKDEIYTPYGEAKELVKQLDPSANLDEFSLYRAAIKGHVERIFEDGKLIGMGWIFTRQTALRKQAVVEDMIVDENQRGKGLGRKLLEGLVDWARKEGVDTIELTSNPKRKAANGLYKSYGFKLHETNHYLLKL